MEKNQTEDSAESKVGNSKVGVKYLFFEDEASQLDIGFYPQVDFVKADRSNPDSISATFLSEEFEYPIFVVNIISPFCVSDNFFEMSNGKVVTVLDFESGLLLYHCSFQKNYLKHKMVILC